jgi:hypothetical protein
MTTEHASLSATGYSDIHADDPVELTDEKVRWRAREATFMAGRWGLLAKRIPRFTIEDFKSADGGPSNPHMKTVVRQPLTVTEHPIPVGVVSNTYSLAQHTEVVEMCFRGLRAHGINPQMLRCEVGLTPLGEWMNFRAYFPESFDFTPGDGHKLSLRLECYNSVDGSSRLVLLLGWFRFICTNGMVIGKTKAALRDIHDERLDLEAIPDIIADGILQVHSDLARLRRWEDALIDVPHFTDWVNDYLSQQWGKKAACRVFHICLNGVDVELTEPFAKGDAIDKPFKPLSAVPGAPNPARNLYDVSQALSWIATQRNSAEERLEWQSVIPSLVEHLRNHLEVA